MLRHISETDARADAAARIARNASREVLLAVDRALVQLDQSPVVRPALLASVNEQVTQALRAAGRGYIDDYLAASVDQGRSRRAAVRELGEPMAMSRSGVAGSFGRRTAHTS